MSASAFGLAASLFLLPLLPASRCCPLPLSLLSSSAGFFHLLAVSFSPSRPHPARFALGELAPLAQLPCSSRADHDPKTKLKERAYSQQMSRTDLAWSPRTVAENRFPTVLLSCPPRGPRNGNAGASPSSTSDLGRSRLRPKLDLQTPKAAGAATAADRPKLPKTSLQLSSKRKPMTGSDPLQARAGAQRAGQNVGPKTSPWRGPTFCCHLYGWA